MDCIIVVLAADRKFNLLDGNIPPCWAELSETAGTDSNAWSMTVEGIHEAII